MIEAPQITQQDVIRFLQPNYAFTGKAAESWKIEQLWGAPLFLRQGDQLNFWMSGDQGPVYLTVTRDDAALDEIQMAYAGDLLHATVGDVDLSFRVTLDGELIFDQDLSDNGAPGNGGGTGIGN